MHGQIVRGYKKQVTMHGQIVRGHLNLSQKQAAIVMTQN